MNQHSSQINRFRIPGTGIWPLIVVIIIIIMIKEKNTISDCVLFTFQQTAEKNTSLGWYRLTHALWSICVVKIKSMTGHQMCLDPASPDKWTYRQHMEETSFRHSGFNMPHIWLVLPWIKFLSDDPKPFADGLVPSESIESSILWRSISQ